MTVTGWTLDAINALAFPDVLAQWKYWGKYPPVHLALRAFFQVKDGQRREPNDAEKRLQGIPARRLEELPRHIRDWMVENSAHG